MRFLVISCLALLCLAPHSRKKESVRSRDQGSTMVGWTTGDNPKADFVGGGVVQDSCRGEVKFKSRLNHIYGLTDIRYEVTPVDKARDLSGIWANKKLVFSGLWWWKATPSFMSDYRGFHRINLDDPHEDMDLGEYGSDDGWQEACENESNHISQCDRIFNRKMEYPYSGRLTGEGDPENPDYYEIIFNIKTKDGCILKWTDRLVFQMKLPN